LHIKSWRDANATLWLHFKTVPLRPEIHVLLYIDFPPQFLYFEFQREGRIQSAERAVPTFSFTI